jgi:signal transduction histidine kinase
LNAVENKSKKEIYFIIISLLVLLLGAMGIHRLTKKPDIPFVYEDTKDGIKLISTDNQILPGSLIYSINNFKIESTFQLELLVDSYSIGDTVNVYFKPIKGNSAFIKFVLKNYYTSPVFILISGITGFLFWLTAIFIYIRRPKEKFTVVLFNLFMFLSLATMTSPGEYKPFGDISGILIRSLHLLSYMLVFSCMIHLTFIFSIKKKYRLIPVIIHSITLFVSIVLAILFISAVKSGFEVANIKLFDLSWDIAKFLMLVFTVTSVVILFFEIRKCGNERVRKNLMWILKGLLFGGAPYLLFYVFPSLIGLQQVIPEEILLAFLLLIPILYYIEEGKDSKYIESLNLLKSQAISSLSHELQTPLTAIKMHSETLLNDKIKDDVKKKEYLNVIYGESERLSNMIKNLLDVSRIEKGIKNYIFTRVDIIEVVKHTLDILDYELKKNEFTINTYLPDKQIFINADRDAIIQVLINLIVNAMKYSREAKEIYLKLSCSSDDVSISIEDKGIGISASEIKNVFDLYYRTPSGEKMDTTGTGIGLSLVAHIIKSHNGKIDIKSEPGKGSIFTVNFKLYNNENYTDN